MDSDISYLSHSALLHGFTNWEAPCRNRIQWGAGLRYKSSDPTSRGNTSTLAKGSRAPGSAQNPNSNPQSNSRTKSKPKVENERGGKKNNKGKFYSIHNHFASANPLIQNILNPNSNPGRNSGLEMSTLSLLSSRPLMKRIGLRSLNTLTYQKTSQMDGTRARKTGLRKIG